MERQNISTGTPWEAIAGYSRAVKVGPFIYVAGTTATDSSGKISSLDPYEQARHILEKIGTALESVGASLSDVVRSRVYLTNMDDFPAVAKAHGEVFSEIRPANTLVEVSRLAIPEMLVEIDVDAVVSDDQ
jgi:enamine deaminase RidA (YjgF/YER057c/UK114 family)